MRPYLAIVVDSFREAIKPGSTLWLLLALITLALLVVFPLTYRETRTTDLQLRDVNNWDALAGALKSGQDESKATPAKHLWTLYSDPVKQRIANFKPLPKNPSPSDRMEYDQAVHQLRDDLNELFANPKFVHDRSWSGLDIPDEGRELRRQLRKSEESQTPLSSEEQKRLSRIYFESGFPGIVNASEPTSFQMVYALRRLWRSRLDQQIDVPQGDHGSAPLVHRQVRPVDWPLGCHLCHRINHPANLLSPAVCTCFSASP
ncbi:MAG: hypothetical protein U0894_03255 [Pirellulales bacterium]